jgi:hypothetical protein
MELRRKRMGLLLAGLLVAAVLASRTQAAVKADGAKKTTATISLTINFNDGVRKIFVLPWTQDMTVLDAMNLAKAIPHGITFEYTGSGATAFLTKIDDVQNQGAGSDKKNWLYWVNDAFADRSFGVYKLDEGDCVLWRFDTYRESDKRK